MFQQTQQEPQPTILPGAGPLSLVVPEAALSPVIPVKAPLDHPWTWLQPYLTVNMAPTIANYVVTSQLQKPAVVCCTAVKQ